MAPWHFGNPSPASRSEGFPRGGEGGGGKFGGVSSVLHSGKPSAFGPVHRSCKLVTRERLSEDRFSKTGFRSHSYDLLSTLGSISTLTNALGTQISSSDIFSNCHPFSCPRRKNTCLKLSMSAQLSHPLIGSIHGRRVTDDLIQFRNLPYACIPRRFARAQLLTHLPRDITNPNEPYDAVDYRNCSIQPLDSIAIDLRWNQLPERPGREQGQSEDCLSLTITCPATIINPASNSHLWPVVAFVHGGALMMGSGNLKKLGYISSHSFQD